MPPRKRLRDTAGATGEAPSAAAATAAEGASAAATPAGEGAPPSARRRRDDADSGAQSAAAAQARRAEAAAAAGPPCPAERCAVSGDGSVTLPPELAALLKDHQVEGLRFIWRNVVEEGAGCILAHGMGLGKTAQSVIFCGLFFRLRIGRSAIVVAPKSTIGNWMAEFSLWGRRLGIPPGDPLLEPVVLGDESWEQRTAKFRRWGHRGGVLVLSYELYGNLVGAYDKELPEAAPRDAPALLQYPGPDLVVLDEGHTIRNHTAGITSALMNMRTRRRLMLTGTPMQNCLEELWGMVEFVRPGHFPRREFVSFFERPIRDGRAAEAAECDAVRMRSRAYILQRELRPFVHRRDQTILKRDLPPKAEYVIFCPLSPFQRGLHQRFLDWHRTSGKLVAGGRSTLLFTHVLHKIAAHPDLLRETLLQTRAGDKAGLEYGWVSDLSWAEGVLIDAPGYRPMLLQRSPKMISLLYIAEWCARRGEKLLVFSQWTLTLTLVEQFLKRMAPRLAVWKLQGDQNQARRTATISAFQDHPGPAVFMISTTAGGQGINLNTAHRAVLFDVAFNPAVDQQAVCRCYRYGLEHPVTIYRLVADRTPEAAIYRACIAKEWVGRKVVDDGAPSRAHVRQGRLAEMGMWYDPRRETGDGDSSDGSEWDREREEVQQADPLVAHLLERLGSRGLTARRVFRHESLLKDEEEGGGEDAEQEEYRRYTARGGRAGLFGMVEEDGAMARRAAAAAADPPEEDGPGSAAAAMLDELEAAEAAAADDEGWDEEGAAAAAAAAEGG
eukprot:TRINITY_DN19859_c1_g2_i1.p1 TRINITY_DN19859_c1_g2~~TRINITY_DN19859_c1_g2_i1.p1  ORF type:complete len:806 (+),score=232.06 TRINITY_DN19859_c1_g2_i1:73-2418(+)